MFGLTVLDGSAHSCLTSRAWAKFCSCESIWLRTWTKWRTGIRERRQVLGAQDSLEMLPGTYFLQVSPTYQSSKMVMPSRDGGKYELTKDILHSKPWQPLWVDYSKKQSYHLTFLTALPCQLTDRQTFLKIHVFLNDESIQRFLGWV